MTTKAPDIDRPPRSIRPPSTQKWLISRIGDETIIRFDQASPSLVINKSLTDEELDMMRMAYEDGARDFSNLGAILSNPATAQHLKEFQQQHAPKAWRVAVGLESE